MSEEDFKASDLERIQRRRAAIIRLSQLGPGIFDNYDLEKDRDSWD